MISYEKINKTTAWPLVFLCFYVSVFLVITFIHENYFYFFNALGILAFGFLIAWKQDRLKFSRFLLWALSIWGLLHMLGSVVKINGKILYDVWVIEDVIRYDSILHFFGTGIAVFTAFEMMKPNLAKKYNIFLVFLLIFLVAMGAGALKEAGEFLKHWGRNSYRENGYFDTGVDLIYNIMGGVVFSTYLAIKNKKNN